MVVGGLPTPTESHADNVVSMAFGMIEVSRTVLSPVDGNSIQVIFLHITIVYQLLRSGRLSHIINTSQNIASSYTVFSSR